ncbi:hypothetical protein [Paenibacillus medicaginis]|uniref:4'-phosphopantetheinyl transferase N-terminal domain-containing protein n=1 Tax=Paenibacillus medicaginis TaxID=1470560 RepID=A0ABV5BY24_9BACL
MRSLAGQLLIRSMITNDLHIRNMDIRFSKSKYGKPYLENNPDFASHVIHVEPEQFFSCFSIDSIC